MPLPSKDRFQLAAGREPNEREILRWLARREITAQKNPSVILHSNNACPVVAGVGVDQADSAVAEMRVELSVRRVASDGHFRSARAGVGISRGNDSPARIDSHIDGGCVSFAESRDDFAVAVECRVERPERGDARQENDDCPLSLSTLPTTTARPLTSSAMALGRMSPALDENVIAPNSPNVLSRNPSRLKRATNPSDEPPPRSIRPVTHFFPSPPTTTSFARSTSSPIVFGREIDPVTLPFVPNERSICPVLNSRLGSNGSSTFFA